MPVSTSAETDTSSLPPVPISSVPLSNHTFCPPSPTQHGAQQLLCALCAAAFPSSRGLSQHIRHRHVSEYNEMLQRRIKSQPTSRIWSQFDDASLLTIADRNAKNFTTKNDLCQHISTVMPRRTAEAIKRRLLHLHWMKPSSPTPDAPTTPTTNTIASLVPTTTLQNTGVPQPHSPVDNAVIDLSHDELLLDATTPHEALPSLQPQLRIILTPLPSPTYPQSPSNTHAAPDPILNTGRIPQTYTCDLDESFEMTPTNVVNSDIDQGPLLAQKTKLLAAAVDLLYNECTRIRSSSLLDFIQCGIMHMSAEDISTFINSHADVAFPRTWVPSKPRYPFHSPSNVSRKKMRKIAYAHIQTLFHHRPKDAANTVLDGRWKKPSIANPSNIPNFDSFWTAVMTRPSTIDNREVIPVVATTPSLIDPILPSEVAWALKEMHGTAAGIDRLTSYDLLKYGKNSLAGYLNMLLAITHLPTNLSTSRVTFIPKSMNPTSPEDYRPVSVAPMTTRCLHKILARRWMPLFPQERLQFAFLQRDGCFEAVNLLHSVIRHIHTHHTGGSFALLDISRAFDTVSHDSIIRAAKRYGAPDLLCNYLNNYYGSATSCLNTTECHPTCGVKQGDPLSPLLFIMVLDEVLEGLDPTTHLHIDGEVVNYIAYADDLVVFAPNANLLQQKLNRISLLLHEAGWSVNPEKSQTLDLISGGHCKLTALSQTEFTVAGIRIPPLSVSDTFQYLGIKFNFKGRCPVSHIDSLNNYLQEISCAPLKPQQRIKILRDNLLPRLIYPLTLGVVHKNTLKSMDRTIHAAIRKWLRLPADTPLAYLHSSIAAGGLGIQHLTSTIPFHRRKRLEALLSAPNRLLHRLPTLPALASYSHLGQMQVRIGHERVTSKEEASQCWVRQLYSSNDGKGLVLAQHSKESHTWLRCPQSVFPSVYINAVKLRGGLLPTKIRRSRGGRIVGDLHCRGGCSHPETIQHILQHCSRTHDIRCKRHNELCKLVAKKLRRLKTTFLQEPCIPLETTYCKPDFIVIRDTVAYILDVTISDDGNTQTSRLLKISKYGNEQTVASIKRFLSSSGHNISSIRQSPVVLTFRGILEKSSTQALRRLSFSFRDLGDLCLNAIQGSIKIYNTYMRGTQRSCT